MVRLLCSVLCAFLALVVTGTAGAARAQSYAEVHGGATFSPDLEWGGSTYGMDTGLNIGATFGVFIGPDISLEADASYTQARYSCCENDLESMSLMANAVYHVRTAEGLQPYVGVGAGAVHLTYDNVAYEREDTVFGWQALMGGEMPFSDTASLFLEYRYQDAQEASDQGLDWEYKSHNVSAGVRIWF